MKRIIASLVAAVLFAAMLPVNSVSVSAAAQGAAQIFLEGDKDFNAVAGDTLNIPLTIKNMGSVVANNMVVSVTSSTATPSVNVTNIASLAYNESRSIMVVVRTPSASAKHTVTVTLTYNGSEMSSYDLTITTSAETSQPGSAVTPSAPNVIMSGPTSIIELEAGKSKVVNVTLKNIGKGSASSITAYLTPNDKLTNAFTDNSNNISSIAAGSEKNMNVSVGAPSDLASGTYPVKFSYIYYDSNKNAEEGSATFYVKVNNPDKAEEDNPTPVLILDGFSSPAGSVAAGSTFGISMKLRNDSKAGALNAQVSLGSLDTKGISIQNGVGSVYYPSFSQGRTQDLSFTLLAGKDMETGVYPVKFDLTYYDNAGKAYSGSYTYYVSVSGKTPSGRGNLEIVSIAAPGGDFEPGQSARFTVTMKNTGDSDIKNVKVATSVTDNEIVPRSANTQQLSGIAVGETKTVSFDFSATADSKSRSYTIGFNFSYDTGAKDGTGTAITESFSQYSSLSVLNPDNDDEKTSKSVPKIIVSEYTVDPLIVQAGQEFDLNITFKNTHASKTVSNIKASFSVMESTETKGNVFTPVNGSNTHYIEEIEPKGEVSHYMRMYTVPDAAPKNYIITISFVYEDEEGNEIRETEQVGINVKQITKLELGDLYIPTDITMGQSVYASMTVHNTGKVTLNNFKIKFESEGFNTANSEIIYGNFSSGSYDYYDANMYAMMTGTHVLKMIASYDDDSGEHHEIVQEYTVNVMEAPVYDMGGDMDGRPMPGYDMPVEPEPQGFFGFIQAHWLWFAIGGVVVVGGAVATVVILRRKKRRASLDE